MKNMLLAVSGMSPAVITETLYGMNKQGDIWPESIKIITTSVGAEKMWSSLVVDGHLEQLCRQLGKPNIVFHRDDILVVPDINGQPIVDAKSVADHEAMADFIMTTVRDFTRDGYTEIHASIAGGRKTMTFYLGYAMSLFGRHFDRLSHVLISEGYENHPEFFYPTYDTHLIELSDGRVVDKKDAEVTLADIPFIRQRHLVPDLLKEFGETVNFRQLVQLINLGDEPEALVLEVHQVAQKLVLYSKRDHALQVEVVISNPWLWVFYLLLVEDSLNESDDRGNYIRPSSGKPDTVLATAMAMKLAELNSMETQGSNAMELIKELLSDASLFVNYPNLERSLLPVQERRGVTDSNFSTYVNSLQTELSKKLPSNLTKCLTPAQVFDKTGERLGSVGKIKHKGAGYGIPLPDPMQQIRLM